jgi:hypothetical protein
VRTEAEAKDATAMAKKELTSMVEDEGVWRAEGMSAQTATE